MKLMGGIYQDDAPAFGLLSLEATPYYHCMSHVRFQESIENGCPMRVPCCSHAIRARTDKCERTDTYSSWLTLLRQIVPQALVSYPRSPIIRRS
jgi:hypothetical protein